jgi:hypothetical protein
LFEIELARRIPKGKIEPPACYENYDLDSADCSVEDLDMALLDVQSGRE